MERPRWIVAASIAVLALMAIPGITAGLPTGPIPSSPSSSSAGAPVAPLPAALEASWADRAGFVGSIHTDPASLASATGEVSVAVTLWPSNLSLFLPRPPNAPSLTSAKFEAQFSPSLSEYQSVIDYFEGYGLSITHTWPDRLSVTVRGPAASIGEAFGTTLLRATVAGAPVQYPETVPNLPPLIQSQISAVTGLSEGFSSFTLPLEPVAPALLSSSHLTTDLGSTTTEVTPSGAHGAYGLDALYNLSGAFHGATSQNIVLLLWGDGYAPSDLSTFFSDYYPSEYPVTTTWHAYPIDGAPAPSEAAVDDPSGGPQELTLDMEWSGSMAPGATLDAVYAPDGPAPTYSPNDTPMEDALSYAVNSIPGVSVISMSFGLPETQDPSFQAAYTTLFAEAETKGITVVGASGDDGGSMLSHGACTATPEVEFPASSPDVLAVGGTAPTLNVALSGQITGIATQPAWNKSGGGLSQEYPAPSWQLVGSARTAIGSGGRGVPDVAGPASDNMLYYSGKVEELGGTSFATPMWAGLIGEFDAVRGTPLGFVTPRFYALASQESGGPTAAFSDVTAGSSCLHPAMAGWDLATGWGTPLSLDLYAALTSTFVDLTVAPSPSTIFPGGSTTVTVAVRNATSGLAVPGVSVSLSLSAGSGYTGPCGGNFGATVTVVTGAGGVAQTRFSVPGCYFGSQATVSAVLLSDGYFGQATATVTVSLLSGSGFLSLISTYPFNVIFFVLIVVLSILVGLLISQHGKRGRRIPPLPPLGVGNPGTAAPSWEAAPPGGPPAPPSMSPRAGAPAPRGSPWVSSGSTVGGAGPWFAVGPSPAPTAVTEVRAASPSPAPSPIRCPSCGTMIPAYSLVCPDCGLARP